MPRRNPPSPLNLRSKPVPTPANKFSKYTLPRDPNSIQSGVFLAPVRAPRQLATSSQRPITRLPSLTDIRNSLSFDSDRSSQDEVSRGYGYGHGYGYGYGMGSHSRSSSTTSLSWSEYGKY